MRSNLVAILFALSAFCVASSTFANTAVAESLDLKQIKLDNARLPLPVSARQSVTCWTITTGSWQGVNLDGVSVVVVQQRSEDGGMRATTCYISHFATAAQREAVLSALMTMPGGLPAAIGARQIPEMRIEPAVITIDSEDAAVIVRLALIA